MNPLSIQSIVGYEMLDSRGNPTVGATVMLASGARGEAFAPAGASTGIYEAHEKRDGGKRYRGQGVLNAAHDIDSVIFPALVGIDASCQATLDATLCAVDGTPNKARLGANAILAVSLASAKAAAAALHLPFYRYLGGVGALRLPMPMMNILNGGAHAANNLDVQEFMILPVGATCFSEAVEWCAGVYHALGDVLRERRLSTAVGDEGGFAPDLSGDQEALELILEAAFRAGRQPGEIALALDAAASEWWDQDGYHFPKQGTHLSTRALIDHWEGLCTRYPIVSIEDGLGERDWVGWQELTRRLGSRVQLVGDDLFVTNPARLREGIEKGAGNAILIKLNQIGTLTETLSAIDMARTAGWRSIISHRSGETEDTTIADLAVASGVGYLKAGAPCRSDRVAKYNRLLSIEREVGNCALFGERHG